MVPQKSCLHMTHRTNRTYVDLRPAQNSRACPCHGSSSETPPDLRRSEGLREWFPQKRRLNADARHRTTRTPHQLPRSPTCAPCQVDRCSEKTAPAAPGRAPDSQNLRSGCRFTLNTLRCPHVRLIPAFELDFLQRLEAHHLHKGRSNLRGHLRGITTDEHMGAALEKWLELVSLLRHEVLHVSFGLTALPAEGDVKLQCARHLPTLKFSAVQEVRLVSAAEKEHHLAGASVDLPLLDEASKRRHTSAGTDHDDICGRRR